MSDITEKNNDMAKLHCSAYIIFMLKNIIGIYFLQKRELKNKQKIHSNKKEFARK